MSWMRTAGSLCSLGAAVTLVGAGAVIGQRYAERHMLATVLGPGAQAGNFDLHWSKSTACAQDIHVPLPSAKDNFNNSLRMRAGKMWLAFDKDALLRKRLAFPHVIIEDAVISADSLDGMMTQAIVDLPFASGQANASVVSDIDFTAGPMVEVDAPTTEQTNVSSGDAPAEITSEVNSEPIAKSQPGVAKKSLIWIEQLSQLTDSLNSERFVAGRQVAVDADMVTEHMQAQFENLRQQSQRLVAEARDLQMQLSGIDNVLRHEEQVKRSYMRLEQIGVELKQQRAALNMMDKRLGDLQAKLRSQSLEEKQDLVKLGSEFKSPDATEVAGQLLRYCVNHSLSTPGRYAQVLADLVRKPYAYQSTVRGQTIRASGDEVPVLAAESTKIKGTIAVDGHARPFDAQGKFLLTSTTRNITQEQPGLVPRAKLVGADQWEMAIEQADHHLKLEAHSLSADGSVAVHLTSSHDEQLEMDCRVCDGRVAASEGHFNLPHWLGNRQTHESVMAWCDTCANGQIMNLCASEAMVASDSTPEQIRFVVGSSQADEEGLEIDASSIGWLKGQLEEVASRKVAMSYEKAIGNLDQLVVDKFNQQRSLMATLRRDAEQHLENQVDELRRIQSSIESLIEQRSGGYMAKQRASRLDR